MDRDLLRRIAAWIAGIISFFLFMTFFDAILSLFDIPVLIEFDEPVTKVYGRYQEEVDSDLTSTGTAFMFLSLILALRIGLAIDAKELRGGITQEENIDLATWSYGLAVLGVSSSIFFCINRQIESGVLSFCIGVAEFLVAVWVFIFFKRWRNDRRLELERRINDLLNE